MGSVKGTLKNLGIKSNLYPLPQLEASREPLTGGRPGGQ